jgi:nucleoside phosphorylase
MKYTYLVAAALQEELHAFIKLTGGKQSMPDSDEVSILIGHEEHKVAVFSADKMGMPYNAGAIMDVYHRLKPKFVLYIGTCAGLGDYDFGTVMIPIRAFSYESGKLSEGNFLSDYIAYDFGMQLRKWAGDCAYSEEASLPYKVITDEDICSGAAVVDDYQRVAEIRNKGSRKLRALEMEAFALACLNHMLQGMCEFLVIKAISDKAMKKDEAEKNNGKEIAKANAADFAFRFLKYLINTRPGKPEPKRIKPFIDNLHTFEKSLRQLEETSYVDVVSQKRLADIRNIESELTTRKFPFFNSLKMEQLTSQAIRKLFGRETKEKVYFTTHIINNQKKYLDTWQKDTPEQNDRDDFVRAQIELLNNGGKVVRIFILHRSYFETNRHDCIKMLETHNTYYKETINPVTALVYLYNPKNKLEVNYDFSIVGDEMVFEWHRANRKEDPEYPNGFCWVEERKVNYYKDLFNRYKNSCKALDEL